MSQSQPDMPQNQEEALFALALEKPAAKRAVFLDAMCEGNPALRQRLEVLLAAHDQPDDLAPKDKPAVVATIKLDMSEAPDEAVGQTLGRYKLMERLGEGGCGVVYVAEQTQPVRRRVALKVIKLGMDTKAVVARFEAERQALAMMDHPNIAKVLDAGTTEIGRPYFVMELVRGIRITDYCDQNQLSTKERLELFIKICQAIQHAHQKGIIHRDIKPSNILVTLHDGVPVPKVIDFGIAKATEGRLTDATVYTQLHQFIGTPAYMSPEQAEMSGLDIDTRSDIYSLGVLLYELLAGSTPFDANELMASGIDQMRKTIREKEPVRPSTKLSQTLIAADVRRLKSLAADTPSSEDEVRASSRRLLRAKKTITLLKGDLDWIVMKCLEKDRTRRYETANGLAMDLKRHLNNEPVSARPPSTAYRLQKAFRRNKVAFAAGIAVAAALLFGIIVSTWQSVRATHAKREALTAQASESVQRQKAEAAELAARQRAYASDMNVAKQALDANNLGRALELLNRQRPEPGQKDLRGWEWRYLWQQTRSDALFTVCQEPAEISSLAVSPDGNWLAVGVQHQRGLSVWDLRTRHEAVRLAKDEDLVRAAFSPTEPLLAFTSSTVSSSAQAQCTLHFWNTVTRQMVAELPLDDGVCMGLSFSQDGRTLVTSTAGGHVTLWRVSDGTRLATYPSEQFGMGPTTSFAATPDLSFVAYAYGRSKQRIRIVDLRNGRELWTAVASKQFITALAFSSDGKTLASAAGWSESNIHLWDVATGKEIGQLEGHTSWIGSLVFWPDGKKLASGGADQTIRIWDVASRKCLDVLRGHRNEVWRLVLLPDYKTLVSGSKDGTVCFWDTSVTHPQQENVTWPEKMSAWRFAPDSQSVVTLDQEGKVKRWTGVDFRDQKPLLDIGKNHMGNPFYYYCFSQDGLFLATGSTNGNISVWDLSRCVLWREFKPIKGGEVFPQNFLARGDRLLIWTADDNLMHEWNLAANHEIESWSAAAGLEGSASGGLSPDERLVVEFGWDEDVSFRDLEGRSTTKQKLKILETRDATFSPDGKHFAAASFLAYVRVWETTSWREEVTLRGFRNAAGSVAFSPDGQRLATGSTNPDEALKLWNVDNWQEVLTLGAEGSGFDSTAFSRNGNFIATMSNDGILNLWRAPSWAEINAAEAKEKAESKQP